MRRAPILLSSLTVGRCFTLPAAAEGSSEATPSGARIATPILSPERAWKVCEQEGDEVLARSASGAEERFPAATEVVEIPRQGYETLAGR